MNGDSDTGQDGGAAACEALYGALRRFAYAWETDTPDKEMWAEWQRAKDAMTAYRSATAVPDTGQAREMCPVHQVPGPGGEPIATPTLGCLDCGRWAS